MPTPFDPLQVDTNLNQKAETPPSEQHSSEVRPDVLAPTSEKEKTVPASSEDLLPDTPTEKIAQKTEELSQEWEDITIEPEAKELLPWEENNGIATEEVHIDESIDGNRIIDINLTSIDDIAELTAIKEYEYVLVEPGESEVKISFKQDNIDKAIKYVKYPVYTQILLQLKQVTDMAVEETMAEQQGTGKIHLDAGKYTIAGKTSPGKNGERIWIKLKADESAKKKAAKKASPSMIFGFLWSLLLVWLILGATLITFVVINATDIEDVKFFSSLWISLNDINTLIRQIVTAIFSVLLFIFTVIFAFVLFKFIITKKSLRKKKIKYWLLSLLLLFTTFATWSAWMVMVDKVNNLPNWQDEKYGDLRIFDNDLLISNNFDTSEAILLDTQNLIWPVTLKFDIAKYRDSFAASGFNAKRYIWNFGSEVEETLSPEITKTFSEKWNYEITVTVIGDSIDGDDIEQEIENVPSISISHSISVEESLTNSWGKKLAFDATDLENLWKVQWYFKDTPLEDGSPWAYPDWTYIDEWYKFFPGKIFFNDIYVWVSVVGWNTENPTIDKVIAIQPDGDSEISWEIDFTESIDNELMFEFFVQDPKTDFSDGFIENYIWIIEDKTYKIPGNLEQSDTSPTVEHTFWNFGEHDIEVTLSDSKWKTTTLRKTITLQKKVELRTSLSVYDKNWDEFKDIRHEQKQSEYYIDGLWIPTELKFDARNVRPKDPLYILDDVEWDAEDNGNIDARGKNFVFDIPTEGNHTLVANYIFVHRRDEDNIIRMKETVFIEGVKKDAILDLKMEYDSNYAPVTVRFDASASFIKNDDIVKFIYDYWDGIIEERDAINPGHLYKTAGDYTIKMTARGKTGKTYSIEKELILLPPPQTVKISASLKKTPIGQGIDFSSDESEGQIVEYFWDFGDGNISTEANPTHSYKKAWIYTVKLRADFTNNNSISDEMELEITRD